MAYKSSKLGFLHVALLTAAVCVFAAPDREPSSSSRSDFFVSTRGSDSNNGSVNRPWKTISHAAAVIKPGATVHVAAGEYHENIVTSVSGNSNARVRFLSDQQWGARIVAAPGEAAWQNKGDYVDIVGFDVTGASNNGIQNLGSYTRILSNHVHDFLALCNSLGSAGIDDANYGAHDDDIGGNFVHDIRNASGCTHRNGVGIYHSNLRGHVYNNISVHNSTQGIQLWHAANAVIVANNTVINNDDDGVVIGAGDSPGGVTNDNTIVLNNICVGNSPYGIEEFGKTGPHNRYLNNLVFRSASGNIKVITGVVSGTIEADPQLVNNTGDANGNYQLRPKSPAIDAGITSNAPTTDYLGSTRPQGKAIDLGAYEWGATAGEWPWTDRREESRRPGRDSRVKD